MSDAPTAADVMTRDVQTIRDDLTMRDLLEQMRESLVSGVPVVDAGGRAVGLVSKNDVARAIALAAGEKGATADNTAGGLVDQALATTTARPPGVEQLLARKVGEVMTPVVWSCRPETPLTTVCDIMVQRHIHRVVVCGDDRHVLGMVSALEVVRFCRDRLLAG